MVRGGVVSENGGCGAGDYGNEKGRETEAEVITVGWEPINEKNLAAGRAQAKSREKDEQKMECKMW